LLEAVKKRVLPADDAVVVRKALSVAIAQDKDLEVAGTAVNGRVALVKFPNLKPDIILLDRNASDGWTGNRAPIVQDRRTRSHYYVQHAYRTRGLRHSGS